MVNAHVLLDVEKGRINEVAGKLADMQGVTEVYSVGGRCDLIAVIRVPDHERLEELVAGRVREMDGIVDSETLIAFRVYSRHDLERMFAIGMEPAAPVREDKTGHDQLSRV